MKFQILKHRPPNFYTQQIRHNEPDNMLVLAKPGTDLRSPRGVLENILRWEDDGGKIIEVRHSAFTEDGEAQCIKRVGP